MTQDSALSILRTGANVFLTGEPGSGKTHTITAYVAWLRSHGIEPSVTASTGIAATHIHGMTIHSWSGIGIKSSLDAVDLDYIASKELVVKRVGRAHILIIDEISMLSGETLDMVDAVCREIRHNDTPFGGLQVVLVGDFFQLPPISRQGREARFAWESRAWRELNPIVCYIGEQHRQEDGVLLDILAAIRAGTADSEHVSAILARETEMLPEESTVPLLFTHNVDVDRLNDERLAALPGESHVFAMSGEGAPAVVESLKRGCLSPERLVLKVGASVMCTKNSMILGYANGTLGTVVGFERGTGYPIIETRDERDITIAPAEWAVEEGGKVRGKVTQVPLRLAWAITIHKSQGMSMDAAAMDLSRVFEHGQGYVALSRIRSLSGLSLLGWAEHALRVHPAVQAKDGEFRAASHEAEEAFGALSRSGQRETMERNFITASDGTLEVLDTATAAGGKKPRVSTYDETYTLIQSRMPLADIATERKLTQGTIIDHLGKLHEAKRITYDDIVAVTPDALLASLPIIAVAFKRAGSEKLAPAFAMLKKQYGFDELKLARLLLAHAPADA